MKNIDEILNDFVIHTKAILENNLTGIYLHGSAVMDCYNPDKSDIDLIVVVRERPTDDVKRAFMDMVVELNALGPKKGLELSVVTDAVCNPFVYPTPFELHFSAGHLNWYRENPDDYIKKMNGTDRDLAAHFTILQARGRCLYGRPITDVFAPVPKRDYMDSIWYDVENAEDEIMENPMYLILNLSRVLAFARQGLVLSKKEGGKWALENLPERYHGLVRAALSEYTESQTISYDPDLSVQYAQYMKNEIKAAM